MQFYYQTYANPSLTQHQPHFQHIMNWVDLEGFHRSSINSRMLTQLPFFQMLFIPALIFMTNIFSNVVMLREHTSGMTRHHPSLQGHSQVKEGKEKKKTNKAAAQLCSQQVILSVSSYTNLFPLSVWNTSFFSQSTHSFN